MPAYSEIKATYKANTSANTVGVGALEGQTLTVEFLAADPTTTAGQPRIWVNTTTNILKFYNGTAVKTVTAT